MAVEAIKIKERLKAKFPGVNLSKQRQDAIAEKLAPKLEEDGIDAKLDELNELLPFADIAKQDDKIRTLEAKNKEPKKDPVITASDDDVDDDAADEDRAKSRTPKYVKELLESVKTLTSEVSSLKSQKQQETIKEKLSKHDKLKDIKPSFWNKRQLPAKDEDIDSFAEEVATDHAAFLQESGYEGITPHTPAESTAGNKNGKAKIDPDLIAFAKQQNEVAVNGTKK
jgi:hypothetical protein